MIVKLLTEHHLEFLFLTGGCKGSSESTLVKMSDCWKSHALTQFFIFADAPVLTGLLATFKEFVFQYHQNISSSKSNNNSNIMFGSANDEISGTISSKQEPL